MYKEPIEPTTLEALDAARQIRALKGSYFRSVDDKNWAALRELFTDDAMVFMPETWPEPKSADDAVASFANVLSVRNSVHTGYLPSVVVHSATTASGTWVMDDRLYRREELDGVDDHRLIQGFGTYHERYRRDDGRWRFEWLLLIRSRVDHYASITDR